MHAGCSASETMTFQNPLVQRITHFLNSIGIAVHAANIDGPTFLPGIRIEAGALLIEEAQLKYPGDLLHEA